ncbi:hypothetical protein NLG97_g3348 [Lecanicillium saksenae]|uniref:Uncharacterized protein n=1 Tax=Lecanicillium saksenae TaxID=468837 RepID=A0ACC1QYB4_9HYPO|nr:hypothetical protein NLG97_g3348 [Lecanicillium saksenae]
MALQQPAMAPDGVIADDGHNLAKFLSRASNRHHDDTPEQGIADSNNTSTTKEALTAAEIERLGRVRPACFATWWSEVAFVVTVVSQVLAGGWGNAPFVREQGQRRQSESADLKVGEDWC